MLEVLLVRHGVTAMNETRRWQGWEDTPLSEMGRDQARRVARALARDWAPVQALYCSPLRRAAETARAVGDALRLSPIPVDHLRECNFGEVSGLTIPEIEARYPGIIDRWASADGLPFCWPGGESREAFYARARSAVEEIVRRERTGRIVVVSHGGTMRAALHSLLPNELPSWWDISLANCSITVLRFEAGAPTLVELNRTAHLSDLALPDTVNRSNTATPSRP
jgi:broad specificity phosphatase PhoE